MAKQIKSLLLTVEIIHFFEIARETKNGLKNRVVEEIEDKISGGK